MTWLRRLWWRITVCRDIGAFADGELTAVRADRVRRHLPRCERCRDVLTWIMQLDALALAAMESEVPHGRR